MNKIPNLEIKNTERLDVKIKELLKVKKKTDKKILANQICSLSNIFVLNLNFMTFLSLL